MAKNESVFHDRKQTLNSDSAESLIAIVKEEPASPSAVVPNQKGLSKERVTQADTNDENVSRAKIKLPSNKIVHSKRATNVSVEKFTKNFSRK